MGKIHSFYEFIKICKRLCFDGGLHDRDYIDILVARSCRNIYARLIRPITMRPALFIYERSKLFFKMLLVLHLSSDSLHIIQISSLRGPTFGLCSAWRYGDFATNSIFISPADYVS